MEKLSEVASASPVFSNLAQKVFPDGSVIRCARCKVKRNCTTSEIAQWMRIGFPICKKCGGKTELDNPYRKTK